MKKVLVVMTAIVVLTLIPAILYGKERGRVLAAREEHLTTVEAANEDTILDGVYIGPVDVSGLTEEEAYEKVEALVDDMKNQRLTVSIGEAEDTLPIWDTGFAWINQDAAKEAVSVGKSGNILERFKEIHDLEEEPYIISIERTVNEDVISGFVSQEAAAHDVAAVDPTITRNDEGALVVTPGQDGIRINRQASAQAITNYLTRAWQGETPVCSMTMEITKAGGDEEALYQIKDVLGEGVTDFSSSSESRAKNVKNGTEKVNGHILYPGETFSVLEALVPFNEENGYDPAPSYVDGRTEDSFGGGICQVSSTLYLAVLRAELEVVKRSPHSMTVGYVKPSMDAAIAEGSKDFQFRNNLDYPIYIYANASGGYVTMRIYGVETRDENRKVTYESEVLEKIEPDKIKLVSNVHYGLGHIKKLQSASNGVKACLWKIVTVDGEEVSREQINSSSYAIAYATYEIGVVSGSEEATSAMYSAIDRGTLEAVNEVINRYGTYETGYSG